MLKNYLAATIRYFKNHKSFVAINILGLTTALSVCYFASLYVSFELSYDSHHDHADDIYRLVTDVKTPGGTDYRGSSAPMGPVIRDAFPEVRTYTRVFLDYLIIQNEYGLQNEETVAYADSSLFSVFTFPLSKGDPRKVLNVPYHVVLSQSCATRYFGARDPVGQTLLINGKDRAYVTGVMNDIPQNSHFRVDMLVSLSTLLTAWNPSMATNWGSLRANTYLLLRPDSNPEELNDKINRLIGTKVDQGDSKYLMSLEPLRRVYLHGRPRGSRSGSAVTGNVTNLYICSLVAIMVLLIASLNFINLATAFSMQRAKEIGVRKLLGASRRSLMFQFMTDAVVLSVVAFAFSLLLIGLATPVFNQISGKSISTGILDHPAGLWQLLAVSIFTGALSGLYPALFLSAFQPAETLKGRFASSARGVRLRTVLVTGQFMISFMLIVATTVLYKQLHFMQNQELGFRKEHMLAIDFQFDWKAGSEFTKNRMMNVPGVSMASVSSSLPGRPNHKMETTIRRADGEVEVSAFDAYFVDYDFIEQYELKIIAGRSFSNMMASDATGAMIINEAAVKKLGYQSPDDVIGKPYSQYGRVGVIIGVVNDFHFQSFREEVQPLTFQAGGMATFMTLTISQTDLASTIAAIEKEWKSAVPDLPMIYFFTDEAYNLQYESEKRFSQLFVCLVGIAIIISCLGLFGLSVFSTLQRTKEIGIRKVLGSSAFRIVTLLTKDLLILVGIAILVGIPLSWFAMTRWLEEFAYRTRLSFWIFLVAGLMLALIAVATVFVQTLRAASADPVKSLKAE